MISQEEHQHNLDRIRQARRQIGQFLGESTNGGLSQNTNLLHNALFLLKVELAWRQGLSVDEV